MGKIAFWLLLIALSFQNALGKIHLGNGRSSTNGVNVELSLNGDLKLKGTLGLGLPDAIGLSDMIACPSGEPSTSDCYQWGDFANLTVRTLSSTSNSELYEIEWSSTFANRLQDCFEILEGVHWYGGGEMFTQSWPIETQSRPEVPFVTADSMALPSLSFGGVTENYWLLSSGAVIHVSEDTPLFFSVDTIEANKVCFAAMNEYPYHTRTPLNLKYVLGIALNAKEAHLQYFPQFYDSPKELPDERMILQPLWSTWAQYKEAVNQSLVLEYAHSLQENGFGWSSHIEIDDHWETCYGEQEFNLDKFPDPAAMVQALKEMDLRVTLWIHPFINNNCPSFTTAQNAKYLVQDPKKQSQLTSWWQGGNAGIVDATKEEAATWYKSRLQKLKDDYGIDSFKFDAGETNWLPYANELTSDLTLQPNSYSTKYVEMVSTFGGLIEVRVGRRNQNQPVFFRMLDKDSRWELNNGLKSLIPTMLHFGIVGYPFTLPDMIGGNLYNSDEISKELFIRWMQANVFMPAVQFSVTPWDFDQETVNATLAVLDIRQRHQDQILAVARESITNEATPICRPMFWVDPNDPVTFTIDDQYMLGDLILVAPVLEEGAVTRDIYLPQGQWNDANNADPVVITGPIWLRDYPAPLTVIPYFYKVAE